MQEFAAFLLTREGQEEKRKRFRKEKGWPCRSKTDGTTLLQL